MLRSHMFYRSSGDEVGEVLDEGAPVHDSLHERSTRGRLCRQQDATKYTRRERGKGERESDDVEVWCVCLCAR